MKKGLAVNIYASTMFLIVGILFYPYSGIDIGVAFFELFGLSSWDAGGVAMSVTPLVLLLAFLTSMGYGCVFLYRRKNPWQFLVEAVLSVVVILQLPTY